jgi:putative acetyltransferase
VQIRRDNPRDERIVRLLAEHLADMALHSPPESIHALDIEALCGPEITFWGAWDDAQLLGCAALLELDGAHGEIKSMRTAVGQRRSGVASRLLEQLVLEAGHRGYSRLSLETGSAAAFAPARALYARHGFVPCAPFASYVLDPYSVFMTRELP